MRPALLETLRSAQRFGFFGDRPVEQAAEQALDFVAALGDVLAPARVLDLGSGGGLPGLVVADARPDLDVVLLDRRQKRTDFLERAVTRLALERTTVMCADVSALIRAVRASSVAGFEVVMARGFGPPEFTLRSAVAVLTEHGRVLISEPPEGDRWPPELLADVEVVGRRRGSVRDFRRIADHP